ncbi:MAG: phosphoglycerate dehydrogenase [Dehalococcoidia bacterium]
MARVLVTDRVSEDGIEMLRTEADVDVRFGISPAELIQIIPDYEALVVRSETKVTAEVLEAGRNLVVVGRAGVGVDNIDVEAATRAGVIVVNAPAAITVATAEHTVGLMIALARHIAAGDSSLKAGRWDRSKLVGVELRGKTLGVIGLGRIGSQVARVARAMEMNVIGFDPGIGPERFANLGVSVATFEEVLRESDFITLHAILPPGSKHLLDEAQFAMLKPGARIINVARGSLINEDALLAALNSGAVGGAALDVFAKEPVPADSELVHHPKVVATPHLGASAQEAQERVGVDVAEQILGIFRGEPAMYAVNLPSVGAEAFKVISPYLDAARDAASLAMQLSAGGQFQGVEIEYLGELANLDISPLKASIVKGLLASVSEENVTLVNASLIAEQRGMKIVEKMGSYEGGIYKDLIRVHLTTSAGRTTVSSTVGHDGPHIAEINDFWVDISPGQGHLLICENLDAPGMIGRIGSFLGEKNINISFMRVGREEDKDRALMVLGLDSDLDADTLSEILRIPNIFSARIAQL